MYIDKFVILLIASIAFFYIYATSKDKKKAIIEKHEETKDFITNLICFYDNNFSAKVFKTQLITSLCSETIIKLNPLIDLIEIEKYPFFIDDADEFTAQIIPDSFYKLFQLIGVSDSYKRHYEFWGIRPKDKNIRYNDLDFNEWIEKVCIISKKQASDRFKENFKEVIVKVNSHEDVIINDNYRTGCLMEINFIYQSKLFDKDNNPVEIPITVKLVNRSIQRMNEEVIISENNLLDNYFEDFRYTLAISEEYCFQIDYHDTFTNNNINVHNLASGVLESYFNRSGFMLQRGYFYNLLFNSNYYPPRVMIEPLYCFHGSCKYSRKT